MGAAGEAPRILELAQRSLAISIYDTKCARTLVEAPAMIDVKAQVMRQPFCRRGREKTGALPLEESPPPRGQSWPAVLPAAAHLGF